MALASLSVLIVFPCNLILYAVLSLISLIASTKYKWKIECNIARLSLRAFVISTFLFITTNYSLYFISAFLRISNFSIIAHSYMYFINWCIYLPILQFLLLFIALRPLITLIPAKVKPIVVKYFHLLGFFFFGCSELKLLLQSVSISLDRLSAFLLLILTQKPKSWLCVQNETFNYIRKIDFF